MKTLDRELNAYYRRIASCLFCSRKERESLLLPLRIQIDSWLQDNPEASIQDIRAHFGDPLDIAADAISNSDSVVLLKHMRTRQKVFCILLLAMLALIAIWLGAWLFFMILNALKEGGYLPL